MDSYKKYMQLSKKKRSSIYKKYLEDLIFFMNKEDDLNLQKYSKSKGGSYWKWLNDRGLNEME